MNKNDLCEPERIELFLRQKLNDDEQSVFESHLSECDDCRRRLETAVASEDIWSEMRASLQDQQQPPDSLRSGDSDSIGEDASSSQATVLKLLAPTDDDRMLGRWGTYEVVGVVGSGGMGVVLKALDTALNRYVAIKILAPHLGSSGAARKRFSREGRASAAVVHDNVIEIYHVAEAGGLPYLVMPYVRGPSLQRRLDDEGPLAVVEILRVGMQAAAGLAAAHAQGLVHRDVKPANILLADGIERVKLTDFGLARAADDASLTRTGIIAGTPQYMSPEQARGEPVDQRSDLFSLGSVLYAMCTGRPPFRAETSYGVLRRITDEEPRPIREINPDIPEWLCGIVARLMAKRPDDRFQSASEVAALLEQCLAHVQQPTVVPLPAYSPLPLGEGQGVRAVADARKRRPFAGWSGRKRALASVIALLFFGGLGVALGILIHVKKGDKTTTIEVPDGSTARVDADGSVSIELPNSPVSAAPPSDSNLPALCFDGRPGSYVSVPNMDMNRLTFATWVKRDVTQQKQYMIMSSRNGGWGVYFSEEMGSIDYRGGHNDLLWFTYRGYNCWPSDVAVADTEWHFVAVTLEDRVLRFYVDGKPAGKATMPYTLAGEGGDYWLGGVTPSDTTPHDGLRGCLAETLIFDRALDSDEIARLYRRGREPRRAMLDGLIAGYHFDEGRGTTVNDFSDHGRNGTLHGGVKWVRGADVLPSTQIPAASAPHAHAVHFDGEHYAKVEQSPKFTAGDFTISLWFNPVRVNDWIDLFARGFAWHDQQGDIVLKFHRDSGNLDFQARTGDQQWLFGWDFPESRLRSVVRYGQWNHVAVTRRGDRYEMWINGARVGNEKSAADISDADNTNPFIVGGMMGDGDLANANWYRGALDDFRIFRRCLSDKEIGTLYDCNGDAAALDGEGRVKIGPLVTGSGSETDNAPRAHALQFDGTSAYVDLGHALDFGKISAFSVDFWMKSPYAPRDNQQMIVGKGAGFYHHDAPGWTVFTAHAGFLYFQLHGSSKPFRNELQAWNIDTLVRDGRWHHVVVTYNGNRDLSGVAFYIDGKAKRLGSDSNNLRDGDIRNFFHAAIGAPGTPGIPSDTYYQGALSELHVFDRAITPADVAKLYAGGAGNYGAIGVGGLVAGYHFDEGQGTKVADFSGHGRDGTLKGATWVSGRGTVAVPHPNAVQFDGSHYAKLEPPPKFTSSDFTVSLWFNPTTAGRSKMLFHRGYGYGDQPGDIDMHLNVYSGDLDFQARTADNEWLFGWDIPESRLRNPVRYGQWNHAVVTRRGKTYTMWMNGAQVASEKSAADISDAKNTNPFIVGGIMEDNGAVDMFQGALDDFRIFRRCLSDKEIGLLYNADGAEAALADEGRVKVGLLRAADTRSNDKPDKLRGLPIERETTAKIAAQRIATLVALVRTLEADYALSGPSTLRDFYDAQDKLLNDQPEAAKSKAERVAVWENLLKARQEMEKKAEANFKSGTEQGSRANYLRARAERQKAELGLAKEKARGDSFPKEKASAAKKVKFVIGPKAFAKGDEIVIQEVRSELGTLAKGDTVTVKGTCTLRSQAAATLWFYITTDVADAVPGPQPETAVSKEIVTGTASFELKRPIDCKGHLHLRLYDHHSGNCVGTVYFGTKAQMKEISHWNVTDRASSPSEDPVAARGDYERGQVHERNKQYADAVADYSQAIMEACFSRSSLYFDGQPKPEYAKAVSDLTKVLEIDPKDFAARFNRALAYESLREYDKAIADYTKAIEGDTDFSRIVDGKDDSLAMTHHYRGRAYQWYKHDNAKAVADFTEALRLDPKIEMVHYRRGQAYNSLKEYAKAAADFTAALDRDPDYPNLLCAYAWQLATCPDPKFRDGKKALELARKANQEFKWQVADQVETLAAANAERGQFEEAVKWQKKAIELFAAKAKAHPEDEKAMRQRLRQYEARKPYRAE